MIAEMVCRIEPQRSIEGPLKIVLVIKITADEVIACGHSVIDLSQVLRAVDI